MIENCPVFLDNLFVLVSHILVLNSEAMGLIIVIIWVYWLDPNANHVCNENHSKIFIKSLLCHITISRKYRHYVNNI